VRRARSSAGHGRSLAVALLAVVALTGCSPQQQAAATPLGPCGDDARATGGYPELEAQLPTTLGEDGRAPDTVDSGRSCSDQALGTLKQHGVTELHFAGATWKEGSSDGTVIAVLATPAGTPPLEEPWVEEFYEAGAERGKKTDNIETSSPTLDGAGEVFRVDTLNDLSLQTVVTWQTGDRTNVVIVATEVTMTADRAEHDRRVALAVEAAATPVPSTSPVAPGPSPGCGCGPSPGASTLAT
jgi:hypothetical protein